MKDQRFHSLDAMRGIAAIAVLIYHFGLETRSHPMPHGYLAVDYFFMLSGFILTRTYEVRLKQSLTAWRFILIRIIRLYPLFMLGVLFGVAVNVGQIHFNNPHALRSWIALVAFLFNIVMLPSPASAALFPLNGPGWSLFIELVLNILMALVLVRLPSRFLTLLCLVAGLGLLFGTYEAGNAQFGPDWGGFIPALFRAVFSFSLGMLIAHRLRTNVRSASFASVLVISALVIVLAGAPSVFAWLYDAVIILILMPIILWFGARCELPNRFHKAAAILGDVSYPLYAIQVPLLKAFSYILVNRLHIPINVMLGVFGGAAFGLAWFLAVFFDAPARRWLSLRFRTRFAAPLQE